MNKRTGGDGVGMRKGMPGPRPVSGNRDKDEDLMLFMEMQKRENNRVVSLLQPVSDEFEANGHFALYGMAPTAKKGHDHGFSETGKNDYDWLKTPPATPLFPSLDMETLGPELVTQRDLPIVYRLSRFSGNSEAEKDNNIQPTKSNPLKPRVPMKSSTPTGRHAVSLTEKKNVKSAPVMSQKLKKSYNDHNLDRNPKMASSSTTLKTAEIIKEANRNMMTTNLSKSISAGVDSGTKATRPKSRGVSPPVKARIPAQIADLSDKTPPNLRTDRSTSASRPRSTSSQQSSSISQRRSESTSKTRTQPSYPGSIQGCKPDTDGNLGSQNDRTRTQVLGSRMLDKFMNARMAGTEGRKSNIKLNASLNEGSDARKSNVEIRLYNTKFSAPMKETKMKLYSSLNEGSVARMSSIEVRQNNTKFNTSLNESSGFGRLMSRSSLDMAIRHMKVQDPPLTDASVSHKHGGIIGRRASSVSKRHSSTTA